MKLSNTPSLQSWNLLAPLSNVRGRTDRCFAAGLLTKTSKEREMVQETSLNTAVAWASTLLLGENGPIKEPMESHIPCVKDLDGIGLLEGLITVILTTCCHFLGHVYTR